MKKLPVAIMSGAIAALSMTIFSGCTSGETDNPFPFRVAAELTTGGKTTVFDTMGGRFYCDNLPDPSKCRYPGPDGGGSRISAVELQAVNDGGSDGGTDGGGGWDPCRCQGNYHLDTLTGLTFVIDAQLLALGRILVPGDGLLQAGYKGQSGDAKVYISKYDWGYVWTTNQYYLDVAGGFEGAFGPVSFSRGFFYSVKPKESE